MNNVPASAVKPSQIDVSREFFGTSLRNREKEVVARNIVVLAERKGDKWQPFTLAEYDDDCAHDVTKSEHAVIERMATDGYLSCGAGTYTVQDKFIAALEEYVRPSQ